MSNLESPSAHILHVVPGLISGGMELTMARLIAGLSDGNIRHSVAYLKGDAEIANEFPPQTSLHGMHGRPNELRLLVRLARLIDDLRPTMVHARNWGAWPDSVFACQLTRTRPAITLSFHGLGKAGYMPARRRYASWMLSRLSTRLVTVSAQSRDLMVNSWGWPRHRVEVIPNGVDTELFSPQDGDQQSMKTSKLVVGSVGNLRPVKNHALLIGACAEVAKLGIDFEIRIAGMGPEEANLKALAKELGIEESLKLVGPISDVPSFLRQLDLFVLSSDSEQHPNALNEAMAVGIPSVATRVGSVNELLDDGRCGVIVAARDQTAMAKAIAELLADPIARQRYATAGRKRVCECYSFRKMLNSYQRLYQGLPTQT